MYKKHEPLLFECMECGEKVHPKMTKCCQRCFKTLCIICVQDIKPYKPPGTYYRPLPLRLEFGDHPACPRCYEEIKRENEEKEAEYESQQEEIYGTEEEKRKRQKEMYGDYEEG